MEYQQKKYIHCPLQAPLRYKLKLLKDSELCSFNIFKLKVLKAPAVNEGLGGGGRGLAERGRSLLTTQEVQTPDEGNSGMMSSNGQPMLEL